MNRIGLTVATALLLVTLHRAPAISFWDDLPNEPLADQLIADMSDEEIIGQVFMVGWEGEEPSEAVLEWIRRRNLGGVKVFGWNGSNLVTLANAIGDMQSAASQSPHFIPLLTATDQEGGWVRHVKGTGELATTITPGNMAIGASGLPFDAYLSAYHIGLELRALGINMNFAPTVDVYVNPEAHVIGPRAFSDDPVQSGFLGIAYLIGMRAARVIATAKHFPGHGNASGDSHGVLPVVEDDFDTLWNRDLVPYRFLISEGLPAILSGHLSFPNVSGDARPASLSRYFNQTVLEEQLGFAGVVITDDLYMGGAWDYGSEHDWGIAEIVTEALRAGNDMVMLSRTPAPDGEIYNSLLSEFQGDPGLRRLVTDAARNVILLKLEYIKPPDRVPLRPDPALLPSLMHTDDGSTFFRDQAGRSVTIVRDARLPFTPAPGECILLAGKDPDFLRVGAEFLPGAELFRFESLSFDSSSTRDRDRIAALAPNYDTVIFCLSDPNSLGVLLSIDPEETEVIVMSILTPIYLQEVDWVETAIAVYGWGEESFRAGFSALAGRIAGEGKLPVSIGE